MDRSFLSRPEVIAASRAFVCIRLATYEDPLEAKLLQGLARTRSGELENTVFCLMAPDGKTKLTRGTRGTEQVYADAHAMAEGMGRVAAKYRAKASPTTLPLIANVRLAVDIAAADSRPLVVVVGKDDEARTRLTQQVAALAWTDEFVGRFVYAQGSAKELAHIDGMKIDAGVVVVQPDKFGQKGTVLRQVEAGADSRMAETMRQALAGFRPDAKTFGSHVREGHQKGVYWETQIPVTDPMEQAARERGRKGISPKD